MKKTFFEPLIIYTFGIFLMIAGPIVPIYMIYRCILEGGNYLFVIPIFGILLVICYHADKIILPRIDYFVVMEEYVEWHGLFQRKKKLYYRDCSYIDIETFNKDARCDIIRGDECAAIYLSTEPYPEDKRGWINLVYCSDTFIKFRYTDKLAEALLEVLPEEKARMIQAFYKGMKHKDEMLERERKERKKRRKRK